MKSRESVLEFWSELLSNPEAGARRVAEGVANQSRVKLNWSGPQWDEAKAEVVRLAVERWPGWLSMESQSQMRWGVQKDTGGRVEGLLGLATVALLEEALNNDMASFAAMCDGAGGVEGLLRVWGMGWQDPGYAKRDALEFCLKLGPERGLERLGALQGLMGERGFGGDWHRWLGQVFGDHAFLSRCWPSEEDEADFKARREPFFEPLLSWARQSQERGSGGAEGFSQSLSGALMERFETRLSNPGRLEGAVLERQIRADQWAREALEKVFSGGWVSPRVWGQSNVQRLSGRPDGARILADSAAMALRANEDPVGANKAFWGLDSDSFFSRIANDRSYYGPLGPLASAARERLGEPPELEGAWLAVRLANRGELIEASEAARGRSWSAKQSAWILSAARSGDRVRGLSIFDSAGACEKTDRALRTFSELAKAAAPLIAELGDVNEASGPWKALLEKGAFAAQTEGAGSSPQPARSPRI